MSEKINPEPSRDRKIVNKPPQKALPTTPIAVTNPPLSDFYKRKPRKPLRWLVILTLLGVVGFIGSRAYQRMTSADQPEAPTAFAGIPVRVAVLEPTTIRESSEFVGTLEAARIVDVLPEIEGRIERILVSSGQSVRVGQPLIVLKPDQTRPNYEAALAAVEVARGDRGAAIKQLEIAKTKLATAKSEVEVVSAYVPRLRNLVEEGALAQLQLDEVLQKEVAAKNNLIAAQEQVAAAEIAIQQSENFINQNRAKAQANLVSLQSKQIAAPIAGVVDNLPVKLGDFVSTGQSTVAKIVQTDSLFLNLAIPANRSAELKANLKVELKDPTGDGNLAIGRLAFISPTVDPEGQTILAKASFLNFGGKLRHGQNVQARIVWSTRSGLEIPTTAISQIGGKNFVFVVDETGEQAIARLTPVELGEIQGNNYQVISGLKAGDRIAVSNILKLQDGVPIQSQF